ncbi:hypothetical protein L208DRAFT_1393431 [Tricholoma matsutake]|nr:hypothetical protein L208DRAFT_1393431 [Tricholoma matsutake 945]
MMATNNDKPPTPSLMSNCSWGGTWVERCPGTGTGDNDDTPPAPSLMSNCLWGGSWVE